MKKYILSFLFAGIAFNAFAQVPQTAGSNQQYPKVIVDDPKSFGTVNNGKVLNRRGADDFSTWFDFISAYAQGELLGQNFTSTERFPLYMYPDTSGYFVSKNSTTGVVSKFPIRSHVVGHTLDPKDSNFLTLPDGKVLQKFNPYTVDSILWVHSYVRNADSVKVGGTMKEIIDTLYVQYFDVTGLDFSSVNFGGSDGPSYFAYPKINNFNTKTLLNSAALKTDTVLLTTADKDSLYYDAGAGGWRISTSGIQLHPNFTSKSTNTAPNYNNVVAAAIVFKPMVKCAQGDTLANFDDPARSWKKKYNFYAAFHYQRDNLKQLNRTGARRNNQFSSNGSLRWGGTSNGWKSYIPGSAYFSAYFFPMYYKVTTTNVNTEKVASGLTSAVVYPNPANSSSSVNVAFMMREQAAVTASITDMNGRVVKTIDARNCVAGENVISISTDGLARGMYMLQLNSKAGSSASKFTVQ